MTIDIQYLQRLANEAIAVAEQEKADKEKLLSDTTKERRKQIQQQAALIIENIAGRCEDAAKKGYHTVCILGVYENEQDSWGNILPDTAPDIVYKYCEEMKLSPTIKRFLDKIYCQIFVSW